MCSVLAFAAPAGYREGWRQQRRAAGSTGEGRGCWGGHTSCSKSAPPTPSLQWEEHHLGLLIPQLCPAWGHQFAPCSPGAWQRNAAHPLAMMGISVLGQHRRMGRTAGPATLEELGFPPSLTGTQLWCWEVDGKNPLWCQHTA